MTREEINESLLTELAKQKQYNKLSDELKLLFYQMCTINRNSDKYKYLDEDIKYDCMLNAYEMCTKLGIRFNQQKSCDAYAYITQIIRSSFASTISKTSNI